MERMVSCRGRRARRRETCPADSFSLPFRAMRPTPLRALFIPTTPRIDATSSKPHIYYYPIHLSSPSCYTLPSSTSHPPFLISLPYSEFPYIRRFLLPTFLFGNVEMRKHCAHDSDLVGIDVHVLLSVRSEEDQARLGRHPASFADSKPTSGLRAASGRKEKAEIRAWEGEWSGLACYFVVVFA
ncbi:hypothetical protein C8F01DRAFT_690727 [Mycena amicta]|nr:hypothetical protein C8F01DRAFT_690727 [Mycena amicta]